MRILSYRTPVFLLFFCVLIRYNTEGEGGVGYPDITFQFPAEAHSVIPSVNVLIKTVNIWWSWTRTNLVPNFLPVAALRENEKTLGTRLGESPQYPGGGGVLPHIGCIGMCRCEVYGFQAVYSVSGSGIQIRIRIPAAHPHPKIPKVTSPSRALYVP